MSRGLALLAAGMFTAVGCSGGDSSGDAVAVADTDGPAASIAATNTDTAGATAGNADSGDNSWCQELLADISAAGFEPVDDGKLPSDPEPGGCYWSGDSMILYRKAAEGDIAKYLKDNSLLAPLTDVAGLGDSDGFINRLHNAHWVWQGQYYTLVLCSNQVDDCDAKTAQAAVAIDTHLKGG